MMSGVPKESTQSGSWLLSRRVKRDQFCPHLSTGLLCLLAYPDSSILKVEMSFRSLQLADGRSWDVSAYIIT
jgi:hypothetical protein